MIRRHVLVAFAAGVTAGILDWFVTGNWSISVGAVVGVTIAMLLYYRRERRRVRQSEMPEAHS